MQVYDFNVTQLAPQEIGVQGRYLKYLTGNAGGADATLLVKGGRNGEAAILLPGQALTWPKSWGSFTLAANAAGSTIAGKVLIGDGRMDDATLQGIVQVVDGGKARTMSGAAFFGYNSVAPVAAQYSSLQLFNPAGSGVRAVVEQVTVYSASSTAIRIWWQMSALPTLNPTYQPQAKLVGSSSSLSRMYTDSQAAGDFVSANSLTNLSVLAASPQVIRFAEPLVLRPGYGLCVDNNAVNNQIGANFEFFEEANV